MLLSLRRLYRQMREAEWNIGSDALIDNYELSNFFRIVLYDQFSSATIKFEVKLARYVGS